MLPKLEGTVTTSNRTSHILLMLKQAIVISKPIMLGEGNSFQERILDLCSLSTQNIKE